MSAEPERWTSPEFVGRWLDEDVIADMLLLPRRISAALVEDAGIPVSHVVDLGAGHGPYLELFLDAFPVARGTWVDFSPPMEEEARGRLARFGDRIRFVPSDVESLTADQIGSASVVVSSRALHHVAHAALAEVYRVVADTVEPGGFVFNLDHVGAPGDLEKTYRRIRGRFTGSRTKPLRPHRQDAPLASTDDHVAWFRAAGLELVDVPWRMLYTALIAGRKPAHTRRGPG
ncbi:MAG: class I SAM-dependent methyltransferase [Gaiellaceae bacterium]